MVYNTINGVITNDINGVMTNNMHVEGKYGLYFD